MSTGTADRDPNSEIRETLSLQVSGSGSGPLGWGGWERARRTRAKVGRESRKNTGREYLSIVYTVICKMLFHLFFLTPDLGINLEGVGSGCRQAGRVRVGNVFREDSWTWTPPTDSSLQGLTVPTG